MKEELWFKEFHSKDFYISFKKDKVLRKLRSKYQEIEVFYNKFWGNVFTLDGLIMITEKDEYFYHEAIAHPPLFISKNPKKVLIIGGGDGGTLKEVLKHNVEGVDLVEIDKEVINIAKDFFPDIASSFNDKRAKIIAEDGVKYLKKTEKIYDVILVDSSEPFGPSSVLFTEEFYLTMKKKTTENGVISAQLGSYLFHKDFINEFFKKIRKLFKNSYLYKGVTPTYPGGLWVYGIFSKNFSIKDSRWHRKISTKYYNESLFKGSLSDKV